MVMEKSCLVPSPSTNETVQLSAMGLSEHCEPAPFAKQSGATPLHVVVMLENPHGDENSTALGQKGVPPYDAPPQATTSNVAADPSSAARLIRGAVSALSAHAAVDTIPPQNGHALSHCFTCR